jgi:hypothetical protein
MKQGNKRREKEKVLTNSAWGLKLSFYLGTGGEAFKQEQAADVGFDSKRTQKDWVRLVVKRFCDDLFL